MRQNLAYVQETPHLYESIFLHMLSKAHPVHVYYHRALRVYLSAHAQ